jgi:hypothetical protein
MPLHISVNDYRCGGRRLSLKCRRLHARCARQPPWQNKYLNSEGGLHSCARKLAELFISVDSATVGGFFLSHLIPSYSGRS